MREATDVLTGSTLSINARHVINATGVWADRLVGNVKLRPSRGAHILVDAARLGDPRANINIPIPGHFGRFVFAIPRSDGLVMIGLTDDPHDGTAIPDAPQPTQEDIEFLLQTASTALAAPAHPRRRRRQLRGPAATARHRPASRPPTSRASTPSRQIRRRTPSRSSAAS